MNEDKSIVTFKFFIVKHRSITLWVPTVFKFTASEIFALNLTLAATWKTILTSFAIIVLKCSDNPINGKTISPGT